MYIFPFVTKTEKNLEENMNNNIKELSQQIQDLRKHLNELAKAKLLSDPKVIETSQKLDALLNEFERLIKSQD